MKKITLIAISLLIGLTVFSQPYLGISYNNKGAGIHGGIVTDVGIELSVNYRTPLLRADVPRILDVTLGYEIWLSNEPENNEPDHFYVTPGIGFANYKVKDFTEYKKDPRNPIIQINEIVPIYKVELGKQIYKGRLFVEGMYCNTKWYGSLGLKVLLN